jgi:hypothetical protein
MFSECLFNLLCVACLVAVVLSIKKGSTSIVELLINLMELNLFHYYCGMHAVLFRVSCFAGMNLCSSRILSRRLEKN